MAVDTLDNRFQNRLAFATLILAVFKIFWDLRHSFWSFPKLIGNIMTLYYLQGNAPMIIHPRIANVPPKKKPPAYPHVRCFPKYIPTAPKITRSSTTRSDRTLSFPVISEYIVNKTNGNTNATKEKTSAFWAFASASSYFPSLQRRLLSVAIIIATIPSGRQPNIVAAIDHPRTPFGFLQTSKVPFSFAIINALIRIVRNLCRSSAPRRANNQ